MILVVGVTGNVKNEKTVLGQLKKMLTPKQQAETVYLDINAKNKGSLSDVVCADACRAPFKGDAFEVTVTECVFPHLATSDRFSFLSELLRVTGNEVVLTMKLSCCLAELGFSPQTWAILKPHKQFIMMKMKIRR